MRTETSPTTTRWLNSMAVVMANSGMNRPGRAAMTAAAVTGSGIGYQGTHSIRKQDADRVTRPIFAPETG